MTNSAEEIYLKQGLEGLKNKYNALIDIVQLFMSKERGTCHLLDLEEQGLGIVLVEDVKSEADLKEWEELASKLNINLK